MHALGEAREGERGVEEKKRNKKRQGRRPSLFYLDASAAGSAAITSPKPPTLDQGATSVATKTTCIAPDVSEGADGATACSVGAGGDIGFRLVDFFLLVFRRVFLFGKSAAPPTAATAAAAALQTATALAGAPALLFEQRSFFPGSSGVLAAESCLPQEPATAARAGGRVACGLC